MRRLWPLLLLSAGCVTFHPSMSYEPEAEHPKQSIAVAVDVRLEPRDPERCGLTDEDGAVAIESFRRSLEQGLQRKGPFEVMEDGADAVLTVELKWSGRGCTESKLTYPILAMTAGVPYLFGAPTHSHELRVSVSAKLRSKTGGHLWQGFVSERCFEYSGIYYGFQQDFSCPAKKVGERLRARLSRTKLERWLRRRSFWSAR